MSAAVNGSRELSSIKLTDLSVNRIRNFSGNSTLSSLAFDGVQGLLYFHLLEPGVESIIGRLDVSNSSSGVEKLISSDRNTSLSLELDLSNEDSVIYFTQVWMGVISM